MKRITNSHHVERIGVHAVAKIVHETLGWIFRDQDEDFGIDAQIEIVTNHRPSGRIIAAQIKAGKRYTKEQVHEGFVFRGKIEHLDYWLNHDLPVIVILYISEHAGAYWQSVEEKHISRTGKGWKMVIPQCQKLDPSQAGKLERLASKQEQLRHALAEYRCPYCGAELVERGGEEIGEHYGFHEVFACGYHAFEGYPSRLCPSDPNLPTLADYKLESICDKEHWFCIAIPKTDRAHLLPIEYGSGETQAKAEQKVRDNYLKYVNRRTSR